MRRSGSPAAYETEGVVGKAIKTYDQAGNELTSTDGSLLAARAQSVAFATSLQQRLRSGTVELLFAGFMVAVAVWLFVK